MLSYRNDRGMGRVPGVKVGQDQAEAGIYMSGLVQWTDTLLLDIMGGFSSSQISGSENPNFNNKYGAYFGFVDPAPTSGTRDLVVRYRNVAGISTDSVLVSGITIATDYFVVVKLVQGNGADDRLFAEAYSAGSYPTQAPISWTVGGTAGIASNCLAEGGADGDDIDAIQVWGGATGAGGVNGCISGCNAPGGLLDELYLGEVWQDVVPASVDSANPTVQTLTPADNSLAVDSGADLVITFNEPVLLGTGNITISSLDGGTSVVIDVASHGGEINVFHNQITINPSNPLAAGGQYAILIDATSVDDENGNSFAGIDDPSTWNFSTQLLIHDGFPTPGAYAHNSAPSGAPVHATQRGFTASNTWGGGTSTVRAINTGLAYTDLAGAPTVGAMSLQYRQTRSLARDYAPTIAEGRARVALYLSGLVKWSHADLLNAFGGFTDMEMNGAPTFTPANHYGAFIGFVADGANRDLVVRFRTGASTHSDSILVDNMALGTDYFVIVKLIEGDGAPDLVFANAYATGSYPTQPPTSWTIGGSTGINAENLDEGGPNAMSAIQISGGGGPAGWVTGTPGTPGGVIDELTLAARWADAVPNAGDLTPPNIVGASLTPLDGSTGILTATNMVCDLDEEILPGTGNITIHRRPFGRLTNARSDFVVAALIELGIGKRNIGRD